MPKNSSGVSTKSLKLNAQWLKNAARTLGMNGISTIADISPNLAGAGRVVTSSISTVSSAASSVRRQQRPIQYLLESNKYVKLGKRAIDNALSDLAHGKFSNSDRGSGGEGDMGGTSTGTYFGDMSDGSESGGDTSGQTVQNIYNVDTKAIDNVSNAVNTQTKYQLEMGKANIDTMVAIASSSMTQQQKNSDAILTHVSEMNRGIQALVAYQNENMTKFISASMAYYDAAGKSLGAGKDSAVASTNRSVIRENGGLNVDAYKDRVKKQFMQQFQGSTAGMLLQMIADSAADVVNNPMEFVSKAVMEKAIPEVTKKALKTTDKIFGSFMTEMLLQLGDKWEADTSDGFLGMAKRFAAKAFGINDKRSTKINRSGKISTDAAVFDGMTKTAITDELPKYARESTAYLRSIVELLGGDANNALRGSRILNRETGRYQSMESFAQDFASSIDDQVIAAMDKSSFGKEMRNMASRMGKNDEQIKQLNDAIDKFFVAAERSSKGSIDIKNIGEGSEMSEIIKSAGLDSNMQKFIEKTISNMMKYQNGMESFNEGRQGARRGRNLRIDEISADMGMLRSSNLFRSGNSEDEIDVSQVTAESLLPQKRGKNGINLPGSKTQGIGNAIADALYGNSSARLIGGANPRSMAVGSVGARLKTIEDILIRGINVRIDDNPPWQGAAGIGGAFSRGYSKPIGSQPAAEQRETAAPTSNEVDLSNIDEIAKEEMGRESGPATGRGSKIANTLGHAKQAMYLMMTGNASLAMNEMSTMLGETMSGVAGAANKHILEPLKNAILPTKEVTDENGNTHSERVTVLDMVKDKFSSVTNSVKESLLGKDEDGNAKSISSVFKEGIGEWKKTIFGDKDPEDVKKEIQSRVPDAAGGAVGGGLIGMLVGGPVVGALVGGAAGFAKKSKWFQDMIFGEVDEAGNEIKKGLIPPSVKKYYDENKSDLTKGAAVGGLLGMVVGGPLLGTAAGIGTSILKKSDKFNELLFGKEEKDEKTGNAKKVGGILNLFKDVTGHYWKGTSDGAKGLSAKAAVGVGGGLLLSLFTPLGPVGGAAAGLAASIATNGDKFKQFLFGKKNENGELEEAGLFQKLGNDITAKVINPLRDGVLDFFDESKDKIIDKMLSPMLAALQPLLNFGGRIYEKTLGRIASGAQKAGDMFTGMLRTVGKKLYDKTLGKAGRFVKKVAGGAVSAVAGAAGKTVGKLGEWAEKRNRKKSLERFNKEDHTNLIQEWTNRYNNDPALQSKSLDEYLNDMKSRHYYNYGDKLKNYFGTTEDREKARQATAERVANRKELRKQSLLINELTGGKYSDTGATAKQAALDAYMQSKRYARGKGLNIKHYGKMSQEDIMKALTVDKTESSAISSAQAIVLDEQLEAQKEAAGTLGKIYDWLSDIGRKITGADNPERQEKREQKRSNRAAKSEEKQRRKDAAAKEKQRRAEAYENALNDTASSTASSWGAKKDDKINSIANKWKDAEKEILKGLKSNNPTVKKAAKEAYPAFFDEDGERIIGSDLREVIPIESEKKKAWKIFKETADSKKAKATQEGFLGSGIIGKIPGMGKVDQLFGKIGAARAYANTKRFKRDFEQSVPHHAAGGIAENEETAVVGERGPEIVQFPNRARVLPNSKRIDVNLVSMSPELLKAVGAETAVQDVRIVGQNGLLATYGTSAKLGNKTNNEGKIKNAIEDEDKLVRYGDIEADNDDYEEQENRTPSLLEKILGMFGGDGGILSKLGLIAGGAGLIALLSNGDFRNLLKETFKWAFGEDGIVQTANAAVEGASVGAHKVTDPTTDKNVYVVDAETHTDRTSGALGALGGSISSQFTTPSGLVDTAKDAWLIAKGTTVTSLAGRGAMAIPGMIGAGLNGTGGALKLTGGVLSKAGGAVNFMKALPARVGDAAQLMKAGNGGFMQSFLEVGGSVGNKAAGQGLKNVGSAATTAGTKAASAGGKFAGFAAKGKEFFKNVNSGYGLGVGIAAGISADIGWDTAEYARHSRLSGDYGFGNAGGFRTVSATAKTITTGGLGIAASMTAAAAKMAVLGAANIAHPGGWLMVIAAVITVIAGLLAAAINSLIGWIQDKSDREYSIRSNSTKLRMLLKKGITYDNSSMNPRYVYCAQESDRVLGLDEGVFVGEADVCMAKFLYVVKENLTSAPGAEVLMYDLINNMAVQGVPFACAIAGSSNICNADGSQANSDFGDPYITEDSGFLKSAKTQVTQSKCKKHIDDIMSDVTTNVGRNAGSDYCWNMEDLTTVYEAGKKVVNALKKEGVLSDKGTVNTGCFAGEPGSGKKDSGWKSLDKICRVNGSYFLAQCLVYINSKVDVNKDGEQWMTANQDYLEILMNGLKDYLEEEYNIKTEEERERLREEGMSEKEIDEELAKKEDVDSAGGTQAQSAGGISAPTERVFSSVETSSMDNRDKADFSKELRYLTAAWAYAHPAELQRWVMEHPDDTSMPLNFRNVITSWKDKNVEGLSDDRSRQELRREMIKASLQYADSHGDIFDIVPYFNWDRDQLRSRDKNIKKYGIGYILRGKHDEGDGTLEKLFSDPDKMGKENTPDTMHRTLFNSMAENGGSEGSDANKIENKGFMGDIAKRLKIFITSEGLGRFGRRNVNIFDEKDLLAGIPTSAPPNRDTEDTMVAKEKEFWKGSDKLGSKLIEGNKKRKEEGEETPSINKGGHGGGKGQIIPFYSQKDPRWANRLYDPNNTETMADAGCGPTALSMAVNGAGGAGPSPIDAADRLQEIGARDNTGTSWTGMDRGIRSYGLESDQTTNPGKNFVDSGLSSGKPVILSGTSRDPDDPFTSQGHYVVVSGKDRNGNYVVNDPNESAPVTYSKEQVMRNASKGWKVGGGRGRLRPVKGGGRIEAAINTVALNDGGGGVSKEAQLKAAKEKWINIIKAVKQAIAQQCPGYSQSNWINITVGGKELSVRTDCSGFVAACLKYMGMMQDKQNISTLNTNNPNDSIMTATGFKPSSFSGWDTLEAGDIVSRSGHVEIFARNDGNTHYVWNCGSNDSVNNPNETRTGGKGYDYVWRLGEAAPGGINSFDVSGSSSSGYSSTASSSGSASSSGGLLERLANWATQLGSRSLGWMTGSMSLSEATDWSNWETGGTSSGATYSAETASTYTGSSGASSANLSSTDLQKTVYRRLRKEGPYTAEGAAAVMGNLYAESGVRSNNVQNSCENRVGSDAEYTAKIDNGTYSREKFSKDSAGYGLAQWTSSGRKAGLYDLAKSKNVSISDPEMQVDHLLNELRTSYKPIHALLQTTNDVGEASYKVMHDFEAPKSRDSAETKKRRESYAISMLENYKNLPLNDTGSFSGGSATSIHTGNVSRNVAFSAMGGRGGSGTAVPYKARWKYSPQSAQIRGTSNVHGETVHGSGAPINFVEHNTIRPNKQNGGRGLDDTAIRLLERIVEILGSSDTKLNNLKYLSEISSIGGNTTNNFASINSTSSATSNRNTKTSEVAKLSGDAYNDARRIVAG